MMGDSMGVKSHVLVFYEEVLYPLVIPSVRPLEDSGLMGLGK
jgi:hypothetical protein